MQSKNYKNWFVCNGKESPEIIHKQITDFLKNDRNFKNFIKK